MTTTFSRACVFSERDTLITDLASTVSSLGKKLADENASIDPGLARIENLPLLSVVVIALPPLTPTVTPNKGTPLESVTTPSTFWDCAKREELRRFKISSSSI